MMKRFWALLTALLLMMSCSHAQEVSTAPIATYTLPQGAEALPLWESVLWEIPDGLEGLYSLMQYADLYGNVYLVRMPHGRAMVSVSCMKPDHLYSAEELLGLWPQIARNIAKEGVSVDAGAECASIVSRYGFDALQIHTSIHTGEWGGGLALDAEGVAFYRGDELLEIWAAAPADGTYPPDDPAAQELKEDRAAMEAFMDSLSFANLTSMAVEGVPFSDPDGRFSLVIPAGSTVLTADSAQEEINQARTAYLAANETGADKLFDDCLNNALTENSVVILAQDQQVIIEISALPDAAPGKLTPDQMAELAEPIREMLSESYDAVLLLNTKDRALISGREHSWLTYWLRSGEADAQLDVIAAVLDDNWLYEVDIYTHNGNQAQRMLWHAFITQTLHYTPLQNALDE